MHWRKNHESDSNNLKSADLFDEKRSSASGRAYYHSPVVVIERMTTSKVKSREKPKGELRNFAHFKNRKKPLGLNVTNCETIASLAGTPDVDRWAGLKIKLYVDPQTRYPSGQMGPAIRISPEPPDGAADAPNPEPSPEVMERLEREHEERFVAHEEEATQ